MRTQAAPSTPLGRGEQVQGAEDVVGAPPAPVGDAGRGGGDGVLGLGGVVAGGDDRSVGVGASVTATTGVRWVPRAR